MTAIPVTNSSGVSLGGLTIGQTYSVWSQGGPWHPHGGGTGDDTYAYELSNDGGVTWSSRIATSHDPTPGSDTYKPSWCSTRTNLDSFHVQFTFVATTTAIAIRVSDTVFSDNTGALDAEISLGSAGWCVYGGQPNVGNLQTYIITSDIIEAVVSTALAVTGQIALVPYVVVAMQAISGTIPLAVDCSIVPSPGATPLDLSNPASLAPNNLLKWFGTAAWNYFCMCSPGAPGSSPPITPVPPSIVAPPGATNSQPVFTCNNTDLCSYLEGLNQQLLGITHQLAILEQQVVEIQRYHVPFAYVAATAQTGLSGTGTFTVSRAIGFQVILSGLPPLRVLPGNPVYIMDVGWISISDPQGMLAEKRPTRQSMVWMPDDCQLATVFGYQLNAGVTMDVVPLLAEP